MQSINKRAFLRVNDAIRAREVRLVGFDGKQVGIVPIEEARRHAQEAGLDLVEVAPDATPPVCKIVDYRKVLYEQKKREREGRKRRRHTDIKEVKMRPAIDRHDYETKMKHIREFLTVGHKVKVTMQYRGREMSRADAGRAILQRLAQDLADVAAPEDRLVQIGRQQQMILAPVSPSKTALAGEESPHAPLAPPPAPPGI